MKFSKLMLSICILISASSHADVGDALKEKAAGANVAYQAKQWDKAAPLYQQLAEAHPDDPRYWYRLGVSQQGSGHHQQALDAFKKAQAGGLPDSIVGYNLAAVYASMGQSDKAIEQLTAAVKAGYAQPE